MLHSKLSTARLLLLLLPASALATSKNVDIRDLLLMADKNNPTISYMRNGVLSGQDEVSYARQQYLPTPSVSMSEDRKHRRVLTAALKQPLWTGGKLSAGVEYAENKLSATDYQKDEVRLNTFLNIIQVWQKWLSSSAQDRIIDDTLQRYDSYRNLIKRRVDGGRSSQADIILLNARITQTLAEKQQTEMAVQSALAQLAQLTGEPLDGISLSNKSPRQPRAMMLADIREKVFRISPALHRMEKEADAATSEAKRDRAALLPDINLEVSDDKWGSSSGVNHNGTQVMLNVSLSPGAGLSGFTRYHASSLKIDQARDQLDETRQKLTSQLSDLTLGLNSGLTRLPLNDRRIDDNRLVLASYTRQFEYGQKTWNDLVSAVRELSDAERARADLESQVISNNLQLQLYLQGPDALFSVRNTQ